MGLYSRCAKIRDSILVFARVYPHLRRKLAPVRPCRARQLRFVVDPEFERPDLAKSTTSHDKPIDRWLGHSAREQKWSPSTEDAEKSSLT
jgi:hypothetical protein